LIVLPNKGESEILSGNTVRAGAPMKISDTAMREASAALDRLVLDTCG
jgi:hypothetical protein